jgi:hypothetical protein
LTDAAASIRGVALAAVIGTLILAGCGGGESDAERQQSEARLERAVAMARMNALMKVKIAERRRREEHPGQTLAPARFSGVLAERYEVDRELCSALSPSELAAGLGVDEGSDPEAIAEAYAKSFTGRFHEPAYEGCLGGIE